MTDRSRSGLCTCGAGERRSSTASTSTVARRRSARDHGPERLGQEHAGAACWPAEPGYEVTAGSVDLPRPGPARDGAGGARARTACSSRFQYPVEIPGVNNVYLLKAALNAQRKQRGEPEVDAFEFLKLVREKIAADAAWTRAS